MRYVLVLILLFATPAYGQIKRGNQPAVTGNPIQDIQTDIAGGVPKGTAPSVAGVPLTGNADKDLQALWNKIVAASNADLTYAAAMAAAANTSASKVRGQCWSAILTANAQANPTNLKDSGGNVLTKPDPHLFTDVETAAEIIDNLSPQGTLFTSCAGAAQLAKTNVLTFINAAITGAAGLAQVVPIPGL